jgi:hypothetical protein
MSSDLQSGQRVDKGDGSENSENANHARFPPLANAHPTMTAAVQTVTPALPPTTASGSFYVSCFEQFRINISHSSA